MALAPAYTHPRFHLPAGAWLVVEVALALLVGGYLAWAAWRREKRVLWAVGWFVIVIAPVLPLRDHFSEYYLAIPSIGVAWLAAFALEDAWERSRVVCAGVAVVVLFHFVWCAAAVHAVLRWREVQSAQVQMLVEGIERAHQLHADKTILLDGVSSGMFWSAVYDRPFHLVGADEVYLVPGGENAIERHPELGEIAPFVMPRGVAATALAKNRAVVYQIEPGQMRNVTTLWRKQAQQWPREAPVAVDVGQDVFEDSLGPGWYKLEDRHRWMGRSAEVRLSGPQESGKRLILQGYCPEAHTRERPLRLTVSADEIGLGTVLITKEKNSFEFEFPLPDGLVRRREMKVRLEVDRTLRPPGDARDLGLSFGRISLK